MREAKKRSNRLPTLLATGCLLILAATLVWRERHHGERESRQLETVTSLQQQLAEQIRSGEAQTELANSLRSTLEDKQLTVQSLGDRCGNLEAQRDHLRAETDRMAERLLLLESTVADFRVQLEEAREALLAAQARPLELTGQLKASEARNAALEAQLDVQAARTRHLPATLELTGMSADRTVFAVAGNLADAPELPASIYLCGTEGIYLDGWLHRREDAVLVGHVDRWRAGTSKLVKGQKVFILPRNTYEADPY